ncbi:thioredoxin domain-containing protein [Candidatus Woesebacteria bacterium]|nr:thioredoxin domain-containing protein [Candidatus Woesebacteria bacterium]
MTDDQHLTKRQRKKLAKEEKLQETEKREKIKKLKSSLMWVIALSLAVFGGYKLIKWIYTPTVEVLSEPVEIAENDWVKGDRKNAKVTVIEYSDFQCPACEAYQPIVNRLAEEFSDSVRIVFRHFPLVSIHNNAFDAARAAEAAGKQNRFWEMHDKLFEDQDSWSEDNTPKDKFMNYASQLGLDLDRFEDDLSSKEIENKINLHIFQANQLGLNSTPTFIVNDKKIDNPQGYEALRSLIEQKLSE